MNVLRAVRGALHFCVIGGAASACVLHAQPAPPGASPTWVLEGVHVIGMEQDGVLRDQTVVIRGDKITSIGPAQRVGAHPGATRIAAHGKYLIPGLSDMHIHLAPGEGRVDEPAGRQLRMLLATGITTARVLVPSANAIDVRNRIRSGAQIGPRLVVYSPSMNGNSVATPANAIDQVRQCQHQGFEGIKTHGGIPRDAYDAMVEAARGAGLPIAGHVTPHVGLARALEAKQQIEHLDGYLAALIPPGSVPPPPGQFVLDAQTLNAIDERRIPGLVQDTKRAEVANGPTLGLFQILASDEPVPALLQRPELRYVPQQTATIWGQQVEGFPGRQAPLADRQRFLHLRNRLTRELHAAGASILAGSDSPQIFMVPGYALHRELEALVQAGLRPIDALRAATVEPARYFGLANAGTIARHQRADLVLLDANPLDDIRNTTKVWGVLTEGRWTGPEEIQRLLAEVEASARSAVPAKTD